MKEPEIKTRDAEKDSASMLEETQTDLHVENIRRRFAGSEPLPQNDGGDDSDESDNSANNDCSLDPARFSRIPQIMSKRAVLGGEKLKGHDTTSTEKY